MRKTKLLMLIVITALTCSLSSLKASATNPSYAMTLSPMTQKIILSPGEEYRGSLNISNPNSSTQNLEYKLSVGPFRQTSSDGSIDDYDNVDTTTITNYNQIMDWIIFNKDSGYVTPNSTETVSFSILVPENAPAGGQYATILVTDVTDYNEKEDGNIAIKSISQIGSIIYAEIAGETIDDGTILNNDIPSFLLNNSLEATSMVKNNGNVHTDAEYILQVWPLFGDEEICTNEENPEKSLVLPETERYHAQTCQLPTVGIFRAKQVVKIFGETSIVEKTIIVCPIWLLFIIIFAIIMLISYFIVKAKSRKKATRKSTK